VAPRPPFVVVRRIDQRDEEVLTRGEVDLLPEEVEENEERSFRNFALLLDPCAHL